MNLAIYEHPLNERVRILMRLELLFGLLDANKEVSKEVNIHSFFNALFNCIEVLERNDIRPTLAFYLDLLEKNMIRWSTHPDIHNDSLQTKLKEAIKLQNQVATMSKACHTLKDDKFLASLRPRFAIAGGTCGFDLPQLDYWCNKPLKLRTQDVNEWLDILGPLRQALDFSLLFLRESTPFEKKSAINSFYQDVCGEQVSLLRVKYDADLGVFPMISGSKHRYAISFMMPDKMLVKTSVDDTIEFQLSTC
ncbi:MAG: cell division protein ZapD [Psychrosphaera sp.]|jgi:cell division protein ZapD